MGMLPSTVAAEMPSRFRRHSMSSKKRVNCEKKRAWSAGNADSQIARQIMHFSISHFIIFIQVTSMCILKSLFPSIYFTSQESHTSYAIHLFLRIRIPSPLLIVGNLHVKGALLLESDASIFLISCTKASIFVEL